MGEEEKEPRDTLGLPAASRCTITSNLCKGALYAPGTPQDTRQRGFVRLHTRVGSMSTCPWLQTGSALQRYGLGDYNSYSSVILEVTGLDDRAEAGL